MRLKRVGYQAAGLRSRDSQTVQRINVKL